MILRPPQGWAGRNEIVRLTAAAPSCLLGRGRHGVSSLHVSREHLQLELEVDGDERDDGGASGAAVRLRHLVGTNPVRVRSSGALKVLRDADECWLRPGDCIFLDGRVSSRSPADPAIHTHAFELHAEQTAAHAAAAGGNDGTSGGEPAAAAAGEWNWRAWEDSDGEEEVEGEEDHEDSVATGERQAAAADAPPSAAEAADSPAVDDVAAAESSGQPEPSGRVSEARSEAISPVAGPARLEAMAAEAASESSSSTSGSSPAAEPTHAADGGAAAPDALAEPPSGDGNSQLSCVLDDLSPDELAALEQAVVQQPAAAPAAPAAVAPAPPIRQALRGLRFAVTGVLDVLTRAECQAMIEKHGGVFQAGELRKTNRKYTNQSAAGTYGLQQCS